MAESAGTKRKIWERLKDTYRISILDDENLEEIGSYNVSLLNFYIFISVIGMLLSLLVISFIVFTPVKRLIPGYGDISDNRKFIELSRKVEELEQELVASETYTQGLKNLLSGGDLLNEGSAKDKNDDNQTTEKKRLTGSDIEDIKRARGLNYLRFITPVQGTVSAPYKPDVGHYGIDIVAPKNSPVKSIMDGVVISADWSAKSGNTLIIQHDKSIVSSYKHLSVMFVKTGDIVKTGEGIAIIGNSGELTTGPHLHFELWYEGRSVNPQNLINFNN